MPDRLPPDGPVDLDALAALFADSHGDSRMTVSELDGYLAGVIVGPTPPRRHSWMSPIWGDDGAPFETDAEAETARGLIMCRYNEIIRQLEQGPGAYRPLLRIGDLHADSVTGWCIGFMTAFVLDQLAWLPATQSEDAMPLLAPMMAVVADRSELPEIGAYRLPKRELRRFIDGADRIVPECVCGLHAFWKERAARRTRSPATTRRLHRPRR